MRHGHRPTPRNLAGKQGRYTSRRAQHIPQPGRLQLHRAAAQALEHQLRHALRRAHHVRGLHRFVRGDQQYFFYSSSRRRASQSPGPNSIRAHSRQRIPLRQRDVLASRGMKNNFRPVAAQTFLKQPRVTNVSQNRGVDSIAAFAQRHVQLM